MVDNIDEYKNIGELTENANLNFIEYQSPGPVSDAYLKSDAFIRPLIGPKGSGKTSTVLVGEVLSAIRAPRCKDGVRRYRNLTTRDSYRQLYKTAIASWQDWFPPTVGEWSGGQDRPAVHKLKFLDAYGPVEFEIEFAAINSNDVEGWLDGYQASSIFMNAAPSQPREVLEYSLSRVGRYPSKRMFADDIAHLFQPHISMDANKTDVDHWFYDAMVTNPIGSGGNALPPEIRAMIRGKVFEAFDMPGGLDPNAENLQNLRDGYYAYMMLANPEWLVNIEVHNRWGPSRTGTPVYTRYSDADHLSRDDFGAVPGIPLLLGLDAGTAVGGRPACVFFQVMPDTQVRVIDELYLDRCGPTRFFAALLAKLDAPHLAPARDQLRAWCDPSAFYGADKEAGEMTWVDIGEEVLGMQIEEPVSNELEGFRLETKRVLLRETLEDGRPRLVYSPRCKLVRKGNNSGYKYVKDPRDPHGEKKTPSKNKESHVQDAETHGYTGFFGKSLVMEGLRRREQAAAHGSRGGGGTRMVADFDPYSV